MQDQTQTSTSDPAPSGCCTAQSYFARHEGFWSHAYRDRDLKAANLCLRKHLILEYVERLRLPTEARILDLGCGTGEVILGLASAGHRRVTGIDISARLIDQAREALAASGLGGDILFQVGEAEDLRFDDHTFDLVIASGLIEWLRWDRWALQEMGRVLKPGGHLIVTGPNRRRLTLLLDPKRASRRLIGRLARKLGKRVAGPAEARPSPPAFSRHWYSPSSLNTLLRSADYEVVALWTHGFGPFAVLGRFDDLSRWVFSSLQRIADRRPDGFVGRGGSSIVALARKPVEGACAAWRAGHAPDTFSRTFQAQYRSEFDSRDQWIRAHPDAGGEAPVEIATLGRQLERVVMVAPHPDDEIIGCGGTLLRLKAAGAAVAIIQMTDGRTTRALADEPLEVRTTVRLQEAGRIADSVGAKDVLFLREASATLSPAPHNIDRVRAFLDSFRPTAVFVPFLNDQHPDHTATNQIVAEALRRGTIRPPPAVLGYEVWSFLPVNVYAEIDAWFERKQAELMKYKTGMKVVDYVAFCRRLNLYHSLAIRGRPGFVEGFFCTSAPRFLELVGDGGYSPPAPGGCPRIMESADAFQPV